MKCTLALLFLLLVFTGCDSNPPEATRPEVKKIVHPTTEPKPVTSSIVVLKDSLLLRRDTISKDGYSLAVESYYYLSGEYVFENTLSFVLPTRQLLRFCHRDSIKRTLSFPVWKVPVKGPNNKIIQANESKVSSICIVRGKKDWCFGVFGGGITGFQAEYYGLYSKTGKLLWSSWHRLTKCVSA